MVEEEALLLGFGEVLAVVNWWNVSLGICFMGRLLMG